MEEEGGRGDILCDRRQRLLTKGYGEGKAMRHLLGLKWKTSFSSRIRVRKLKSFVSSGLVERKGGGGSEVREGRLFTNSRNYRRKLMRNLKLYKVEILLKGGGNQKILIIRGTHSRGGSLVP